jgi:DNA replication protein DnaT
MSSRILTTDFSGLDDFLQARGVLAKSADGAVAVFANNAPAFYALTPARLAQLLELEAKLARPGSDVALDTQFFDEPAQRQPLSRGEIRHVRRLAAGR